MPQMVAFIAECHQVHEPGPLPPNSIRQVVGLEIIPRTTAFAPSPIPAYAVLPEVFPEWTAQEFLIIFILLGNCFPDHRLPPGKVCARRSDKDRNPSLYAGMSPHPFWCLGRSRRSTGSSVEWLAVVLVFFSWSCRGGCLECAIRDDAVGC